jgi:hypothetical protein
MIYRIPTKLNLKVIVITYAGSIWQSSEGRLRLAGFSPRVNGDVASRFVVNSRSG